MSHFGHSDSATQRLRAAPLRTGRPLPDAVTNVQEEQPRLPRYAFDPATLMDHSIEDQLHRLYDGPEFDSNPAHHYRSEPTATANQAFRRGYHAQARPASASAAAKAATACDSYGVAPRSGVAQPRRPASSLPYASSSSHAYRPPFAPSIDLRAALPSSSSSGSWSRQGRKKELIENGLEPLQNLVGLDNYFVERPHFAYRPISSAATTGTSTTLTARAAGSGAGAHRNFSGAAAVGLPHTSFGSLPSAHGRPPMQAVLHQKLPASLVRPTSAATTSGAVRERTSPPPGATATRSDRPHTPEREGGDVRNGSAAPLPALPHTPSLSASSSYSSSVSASAEGTFSSDEVFFDEDPLHVRMAQSASPASSVASSVKRALQPSPPSPFPTKHVAPAGVRSDRAAGVASIPEIPETKQAPLSSSRVVGSAAAPSAHTASSSVPVASAAATSGAAVATAADSLAHGTRGGVAAPSAEARPPHVPPVVAVELSRLAKYPRRRSIDALLSNLLQLRLQHQRIASNAAAARPSPLSRQASRTNSAARRSGSRGPARPGSASQSRRSNSSQRPRPTRLNTSYESQPDSVYSANKDGGPPDNADDVYVRLYHRYRRCECCEVPLPTELVQPRPPPPRPRKLSNERHQQQRHGRRQPGAFRGDVAPVPMPYTEEYSQASSDALPDGQELPPPASQSRFAVYTEVDHSEESENGDRYPHPPPHSGSAHRHLPFGTAEHKRSPPASVDQAAELLKALMNAVRVPGDFPADRGAPQQYTAANEDEASKLLEQIRRLLRADGIPDEALSAEVLRVLRASEAGAENAPTHHDYHPVHHSYGPGVLGSKFPTFSRAYPYPTSELLYPYNLPSPAVHDDSLNTVSVSTSAVRPGGSAATVDTAAPESGAETGAGSIHSDAAAVVVEPRAEAAALPPTASDNGAVNATTTVPAAPEAILSPPASLPPCLPPRVVEDKSVQTSLSNSRRFSAATVSDVSGGGGEPPKSERRRSSSSCASGLANTVASVHASPTKALTPTSLKTPDSVKVDHLTVATSVSHASLSPLPPHSPESVSSPPPLNSADQKGPPETSPAVAVVDMQAVIQKTVIEAHVHFLEELEQTLRGRLADDEAATRSALVIAALVQAEATARRGVGVAEGKERSHLQRSGRYGRDRMLVMEASLKEWGRALDEENQAWTALMTSATAEAAAEKARAEAQSRLRELVDDLLYQEARTRQSIRFTEALVSQELYLSVCDYAEGYEREDVEYAELVAWLELERACLASEIHAEAAAQMPPSPALSGLSTSLTKPAAELPLEEAEIVNAAEAQSSPSEQAVEVDEGKRDDAPLLTPAILLSNEEAEATAHEQRPAEPGPEAEQQASASPSPSPARDIASSVSAMSAAVVFESAVGTPAPEALSAGANSYDHQHSSAPLTPSPPSLPPGILETSPEPAASTPVLETHVVVEVVLENILVPAAPTVLADVIAPLPVSAMLSSPVETPQRERAATEENVPAAAPIPAATTIATERQRIVKLPIILDDAVEAGKDAAQRSEVVSASFNDVYSSRFESDSSRITIADAAAEEVAVNQHREETSTTSGEKGGTAAAAAGTLVAEQSDAAVIANGRSPVVPPLESSAPLEEAAPTPQSHGYNSADAVDGEDNTPQESDTGSERGSARVSSTHRRRRQRRNMRHRTAVAEAVEMEEAGEIRDSESRAEDVSIDAMGEMSSNPSRTAITTDPEAQSSSSTPTPSGWRAITVASNMAQTKAFHSGHDTQDVKDEEDEASEVPLEDAATELEVAEDDEALTAATHNADSRVSADAAMITEDVLEGDDREAESSSADTADELCEFTEDFTLAADEEPISRRTAALTNAHKNVSSSAVASLQADHMHFESSTDDRRFLSPLSNGSEVNTPHVNSQDDFSNCSTPASANPNAVDRRRDKAAAVLQYRDKRPSITRDMVKLPATLSQAQHGAAQPSQQLPSMPSLSASSLSSPHLRDSDGEDDRQYETADEQVEEQEEEEGAGTLSEDDSGEHEASTSGKEEHAVTQRHDGENGDEGGERRSSSVTGKDEVELMHERISALQQAAAATAGTTKTSSSEPSSAANTPMALRGEWQRVSGRRHPMSHASPAGPEEEYAEEDGAARAAGGAAALRALRGGLPSPPCERNKSPAGAADELLDGAQDEHPLHEDFPSGATLNSNLGGSRGSVGAAVSRTQGTYFGSLESDALTPMTRLARAQCWEENGIAKPGDADAVPRPPTPDFVRAVLAEQLRSPLWKKGAPPRAEGEEESAMMEQDEGQGVLYAAHTPASTTGEFRGTPSAEVHRTSGSSHQAQEKYPFPSSNAKAVATDLREDFPQLCGSNYVKSDDDEDDSEYPYAFSSVAERVRARDAQAYREGHNAVPTSSHGTEARTVAEVMPAAPPLTTATPQHPPFPWETAKESHSTSVAESNELIPLKQASEDVWNSGAPNRFTRLRVRVPSPHPKVLQRNREHNSEESTSTMADEETSATQSANVQDTRFMTAVPNGSLRSEDLATAQMQKVVRLHLVDSSSDSASAAARERYSPP